MTKDLHPQCTTTFVSEWINQKPKDREHQSSRSFKKSNKQSQVKSFGNNRNSKSNAHRRHRHKTKSLTLCIMFCFNTSFLWMIIMRVLLLLLVLFPAVAKIVFPEEIIIRAGVLHAIPYAMVQEQADGTISYQGFQIDLLQRLEAFALTMDKVNLTFDLSPSPNKYSYALDLIANDCNTTEKPYPLEDCQKFDMIVGDYYVNPERSLRIEFTPQWLRTTVSALKLNNNEKPSQITSLTQAEKAGAKVCLVEGAAVVVNAVQQTFPDVVVHPCTNQNECIQVLKAGDCALYPDDELQLVYRALQDSEITVTREQFKTQYNTWIMSYNLSEVVRRGMKRWLYAAIQNATVDELYAKYFEAEICTFGLAGPNCTDYCHPDHGRANREGTCVCDTLKWRGSDCSIEVAEEKNLIPRGLKITGYAMFGINVVVSVACGIWLFVQRGVKQVKVMQPLFLSLVLVGCFISSSTILALAAESGDSNVPAKGCAWIPWLYSVGFSITIGTLFAKLRRVYLIFKSSMKMKRIKVTVRETFGIIALILVVDFAILLSWTIVSPLEWHREVLLADQLGEPLESVGYCTSDSSVVFAWMLAAYHFILLAISCYLCYVTRNISTQFSEAKYVGIAIVSNMQIFLVGLPVLFIVGQDRK